MVNYCCVYACGRNSRVNKHLTYYSLPKGKERREQWLRAAGRDDLLEKVVSSSARFCSIHFPPTQMRKKHLSADAVPSLYIPGSTSNDDHDLEPQKHSGVVCNSCNDAIVGFRYKCIVCDDYDLCQKCEMLEVHPHHLMIRISKSRDIKQAHNVITKWREHQQAKETSDNDRTSDDDNGYQSSDDEPITKYKKTDECVDLSEEIKKKIRKEVDRVTKIVRKQNSQKELAKKRPAESNRPGKKLRKEELCDYEEKEDDSNLNEQVQELAFADVGNIKMDNNVKCETIVTPCDLQNPV